MSRPNAWPAKCDGCGRKLVRGEGRVYGGEHVRPVVACGVDCRDEWRATCAAVTGIRQYRRGEALPVN